MKKFYSVLFFLAITFITYAQSPIVTVDRDNVTGPTATGTAADISAIGFTRGVGINQGNGADFSSNNWDAISLGEAVTNDEYMEWSVTADPNYNVEINTIDLKLERQNNGPQNWQIFYSLDGFASTGARMTPVNAQETLATTNPEIFNITGLNLNTGDSGTITFRLYAWSASNSNGWLKVVAESTWADFGIVDPGMRLSGVITNTAGRSTSSNIIASPGFSPTENINYLDYLGTSGLNLGNAIKVGEFRIQDGGDALNDDDALPTILKNLTLNITGSSNIEALALFDGVNNIAEINTIANNVTFSNINSGSGLIALDNNSKTFDVYASFKGLVTDNEQIQLNIISAIADFTGSDFETSNAGGAQTSIEGDANRIEVTRSMLTFSQQPSDVNIYQPMSPGVKVQGVDTNNNLDLDYNGGILIGTSSIPLDGSATIFAFATSGEATFDNLVFIAEGTDVLTATPTDGGITASGDSDVFNVNGLLFVIAVQDFDATTPEWTYTNDIPFFDNGWGVDGYYGPIDSSNSNAAPLDNSAFNQNIFGENDLQQPGGDGTNGFATLSFDAIDVSGFNNVAIQFDWQVVGYDSNNNDAQYRLILDGVAQDWIFLVEGGVSLPDDSGAISLDINDLVSTVGLDLRVKNNGINGYSGFDNFKVVSTLDGFIYTNNTWTPSAPTAGTGDENAYILDGTYTIGTNISLNSLFVANNATTNVLQGQSLTLNGDLLNLGNVVLNSISSSYSSLIVNGTVQGDVVYNRYVNTNASSGGNDLIAAPVTGETFANFAANNVNIVSNPSNPTEKLFGPLDKVTDTYLTWDTNVPAEANAVLTAGIGYRAASTNASTFSFEGLVNTGTVNVGIVNSGPTNPEWNLIGNPYPSYLKLSEFLAANIAQFDVPTIGVYGYDGDASDGWTVWNEAYSLANPNAIIAPGQGFQVSSLNASGTVVFSSDMRSIGTDDDFIPGEINSIGDPSIAHFKLNIKNTSDQTYFTDFYLTDKASLGFDPGFDAATFGSRAPQFSIYSHLAKDNAGRDMAAQAIAFSDLETEVILPLGLNVSQGEQVTVSLGTTTLPRDIEVYLEDTETNTFTLLTASDYIFTANATISTTGRFFLRLTRNALSVGSNVLNNIQIFTKRTPKTLFINGSLDKKAQITIYDIQGRLVKEAQLNSSLLSNRIDLNSFDTGVYIVKLNDQSTTKTQKIIIR